MIGICVGPSPMPAASRFALGCWQLRRDDENAYCPKIHRIVIFLNFYLQTSTSAQMAQITVIRLWENVTTSRVASPAPAALVTRVTASPARMTTSAYPPILTCVM